MQNLLVFQRDNETARGCSSAGAYKPGDIVGIFALDHVFSAAEQAYPFAVVQADLPPLAQQQATMADEQLHITRAARMLPSIRRRAIANPHNLRQRRRRRWQWQGGQLTRK